MAEDWGSGEEWGSLGICRHGAAVDPAFEDSFRLRAPHDAYGSACRTPRQLLVEADKVDEGRSGLPFGIVVYRCTSMIAACDAAAE